MSEISKTRICSKCGKEFPLTPEFFYRNKTNPEGFRCECKICQQKQYKGYYDALHKNERETQQQIEEDRKKRGVKLCTQCGRELPLTSFYKCVTHKDGLTTYCIDCTKENRRKYWEEKIMT